MEYVQGESAFSALIDACFAACNQASADGKVTDKWYADWDNSRYRASELSIVSIASPRPNDNIELVYLPIELGKTGAAFQSLGVSLWYENRMSMKRGTDRAYLG